MHASYRARTGRGHCKRGTKLLRSTPLSPSPAAGELGGLPETIYMAAAWPHAGPSTRRRKPSNCSRLAQRHFQIVEVLFAEPVDLFVFESRIAHYIGENLHRRSNAR